MLSVVASGPSTDTIWVVFFLLADYGCTDPSTRRALFRSAIEEELEVLYDAYYDELEQYANIQQRYVASGGVHPPPPGPGPFPGSVEVDKNGAVVGVPRTRTSTKQPQSHPPQVNGRKSGKHPPQESEFDDEEQDDEEYDEDEEFEEDEEEDDDNEEEDDPEEDDPDEIPSKLRTGARAHGGRDRRAAPNGKVANGDGLFNFGSSLAVTGACANFLISFAVVCPLTCHYAPLSQAIFSPLQMIFSRTMGKSF